MRSWKTRVFLPTPPSCIVLFLPKKKTTTNDQYHPKREGKVDSELIGIQGDERGFSKQYSVHAKLLHWSITTKIIVSALMLIIFQLIFSLFFSNDRLHWDLLISLDEEGMLYLYSRMCASYAVRSNPFVRTYFCSRSKIPLHLQACNIQVVRWCV